MFLPAATACTVCSRRNYECLKQHFWHRKLWLWRWAHERHDNLGDHSIVWKVWYQYRIKAQNHVNCRELAIAPNGCLLILQQQDYCHFFSCVLIVVLLIGNISSPPVEDIFLTALRYAVIHRVWCWLILFKERCARVKATAVAKKGWRDTCCVHMYGCTTEIDACMHLLGWFQYCRSILFCCWMSYLCHHLARLNDEVNCWPRVGKCGCAGKRYLRSRWQRCYNSSRSALSFSSCAQREDDGSETRCLMGLAGT